jgi:hypothetical protein
LNFLFYVLLATSLKNDVAAIPMPLFFDRGGNTENNKMPLDPVDSMIRVSFEQST